MLRNTIRYLADEDDLFNTIYRLAKEKNKQALDGIVQQNYCLDVFRGNYNVMMLLAKEGESAAVDFLMDQFHLDYRYAVVGYACNGRVEQVKKFSQSGSLDTAYAVMGYAMGGYVEQVNQFNVHGFYNASATRGYAMGGHVEEANNLIVKLMAEDPSIREYAIVGYAMGGFVEQVYNLIVNQGVKCKHALFGYARGGLVEQLADMINCGINPSYALEGFIYSGHTHPNNILRLMIISKGSRKCLAKMLTKYYNHLEIEALQNTANIRIKMMKQYQLDFDQSKALTIRGVRSWFLQGPQLVHDGVLLSDMFFKIASLVVCLSIQDTKKIFAAVNKKLFVDSVKTSLCHFKCGFFSTEQYFYEYQKAKNRYEKVLKNFL